MCSKLAFGVLALTMPLSCWAQQPQHTVNATLDYDFRQTHACSKKETTACVKQFNIYDLTGGPAHKQKLFSFPAPSGEKKLKKKIKAKSGLLDLAPGTHTFGATAQTAEGKESDPNACTASANVGTATVVSLNMGAHPVK